MSYSTTFTETNSFTVTNARHLASKVATDLYRMQRFYGKPLIQNISKYENELIELIKYGYLEDVTYGFQRNNKWIIPTVKYTAQDLYGLGANDDDPGRIPANADIINASFCSLLTYNSNWDKLSQKEQDNFEASLPFQRSSGSKVDVDGVFYEDKIYSSGGRALNRHIVRSF